MSEATQQLAASKDKVVGSFQDLIKGADELLRTASTASGEGLDVAREKLTAQVQNLKRVAMAAEETALEKCKQVGKCTDDYVHDKPWQSVGIAAAAGILIGAWLARR